MKRTWMMFTTLVMAVVLIGGLMLALVHSPGQNPETREDVTESYIKYGGLNPGWRKVFNG